MPAMPIFPSAPPPALTPPRAMAPERGAQTPPMEITQEWVERYIVPHLRALSRMGIHIIFDSGVEPLTRGSSNP